METVDSQRIGSVLEYDGLQCVSFVTPMVLAASDQLGGVLGQDVQDVLQQHAAALGQLGGDAFEPHELLPTAAALMRVLRASPHAEEALASLHTTRSPGMLQLLSYFDRHRAVMLKRLHTTVEEDAANKARTAARAQRLEAAGSERLQLEHRLKLQRLEQARQTGALQQQYDAAAADLADLRSKAAARLAGDEAAAAAEAQAAQDAHVNAHAALSKQLEAAQRQLAAARAEASEASGAASKGKRRALQDCEAAIAEYDADMGARQAEVDAALAAHAQLTANIQRVTTEAALLRAERLAHEEAQRAAAEAARRAEMAALRREAAAYCVQNAWKVHRKRKTAAAKAAAKGKKGGGKAGGAKAAAASPTKGGKAAKGGTAK